MFIPFQEGYSISRVPSTYTPYFSSEFQQDWISTQYPTAFNGSTVRLENLVQREDGFDSFSCSPLDFYSFLTSNLLAAPTEITSDAFDNYLTCSYLANAIAVSILIYDSNSVLLVNRSDTVSLSPNSVGVSVTGGVTLTDLKSSDCLRSAVQIEVKEELGLSVSFADITVSGLYISKDKLQPVAICFVEVSDLNSLCLYGVDTDFEVQFFEFVSFQTLSKLDLTSSTDTTYFHLNYFISEILPTVEVN